MQTKKQILNDIAYILANIKHTLIDNKQDLYTAKRLKLILAKLKDADDYITGLSIINKPIINEDSISAHPLRGVGVANPDTCTLDLALLNKPLLDKALAANADTDAVAGVIDAIINDPRQDAQPKTNKEAAIKRSIAVEEALAKRYKALHKAVIAVITKAIFGPISVDDAANDIIKLVNAERIIDVAKDAGAQEAQTDTKEVVRLFTIDMIADAVHGKVDCIQAADAIISLIDTANKQDIEDYI